MWGQWRGSITGTNNGQLVLNIDKDNPGVGRMQVADNVSPHSAVVLIGGDSTTLTATLGDFEPHSVLPQGVRLPQKGDIQASISGLIISGTWRTDLGTSGQFALERIEPQMARPATQKLSWNQFVEWALSQKADEWIYRGQPDPGDPLVSSFHRTGRRDLFRYIQLDIPRLRRTLEGVLNTRFDLNNGEDFGTLLNIGQHHGFPTPLLDFTESPFIAAYFAFSGLRTRIAPSDTPVRIFAFDTSAPSHHTNTLREIAPTFTRFDLLPRENPRVLPQQSVNMFTNVVDIERFISALERVHNRTILEIIEIPSSEAPDALRALRSFGVSPANLFPGVEGACRGLTERFFWSA